MQSIETSLVHKVLFPRRAENKQPPALILLHGRGANEDDLLSLSEYLDDRVLFIAARAPFTVHWSGGYTWYDILEVGTPEPRTFAESFKKLIQFHADVKNNYPIDPNNIFYLGFSMGTILSYAVALTNPQQVKGVIANSGYIPEEISSSKEFLTEKFQWNHVQSVSFFVAHGVYDPIIPVEFARRAKFLLEQAHVNLFYREYEMAHQISEESLGDMSRWLTEKLNTQMKSKESAVSSR